jgi:hypothetical protein
MTTSANDRTADERMLQTSRDHYRDLSEALSVRIAAITRDHGVDPKCKETAAVLTDQRRALQTVLDIEANLVKRSNATDGGGSFELDLDGARAEIAARVARWVAEGGA